MNKIICEILKSPLVEDMYLYVQKSEGVSRVPEALLEKFGKPKSAMTLLLTADKKLAHADIHKVMAALEDPGYFLQLPRKQEDYMSEIAQANSKLGG